MLVSREASLPLNTDGDRRSATLVPLRELQSPPPDKEETLATEASRHGGANASSRNNGQSSGPDRALATAPADSRERF